MENSQIEWTTHTFNPWHGCMKVSEGCKNCYAESLDNRWNKNDPHWGPNSPRKPMSDAYWLKPIKWNEDAKKAGVNAMVFCASMADVFEGEDTLTDTSSILLVFKSRIRLFQLIATTPFLTWQLLTKRPEWIMPILSKCYSILYADKLLGSEIYRMHEEAFTLLESWIHGIPPANVWIGTSVENQKAADDRIPELLKIPAKVRFLSCEPLLGPVNINNILREYEPNFFLAHNVLEGKWHDYAEISPGYTFEKIHWVIAGGESGHGARPMHPDWVTSLRDQCQHAEVAFFLKQWGEYLPKCQSEGMTVKNPVEFPSPNTIGNINTYYKMGKKESGSLLDGKEYKEFPR